MSPSFSHTVDDAIEVVEGIKLYAAPRQRFPWTFLITCATCHRPVSFGPTGRTRDQIRQSSSVNSGTDNGRLCLTFNLHSISAFAGTIKYLTRRMVSQLKPSLGRQPTSEASVYHHFHNDNSGNYQRPATFLQPFSSYPVSRFKINCGRPSTPSITLVTMIRLQSSPNQMSSDFMVPITLLPRGIARCSHVGCGTTPTDRCTPQTDWRGDPTSLHGQITMSFFLPGRFFHLPTISFSPFATTFIVVGVIGVEMIILSYFMSAIKM